MLKHHHHPTQPKQPSPNVVDSSGGQITDQGGMDQPSDQGLGPPQNGEDDSTTIKIKMGGYLFDVLKRSLQTCCGKEARLIPNKQFVYSYFHVSNLG